MMYDGVATCALEKINGRGFCQSPRLIHKKKVLYERACFLFLFYHQRLKQLTIRNVGNLFMMFIMEWSLFTCMHTCSTLPCCPFVNILFLPGFGGMGYSLVLQQELVCQLLSLSLLWLRLCPPLTRQHFPQQ